MARRHYCPLGYRSPTCCLPHSQPVLNFADAPVSHFKICNVRILAAAQIVQRRRTGPGPVLDQNQQFGWVEFQLSILLLSRQAGTPLEGIVLFADGRSGDWSRVPTTFASRSNADAPTTLSREIYANLVRT